MPKENLDSIRATVNEELGIGKSFDLSKTADYFKKLPSLELVEKYKGSDVSSNTADFSDKWSIYITYNCGMDSVEDSCANVLKAISAEHYYLFKNVEYIFITVNKYIFTVYETEPYHKFSKPQEKLYKLYEMVISTKHMMHPEWVNLSNEQIKKLWTIIGDYREHIKRRLKPIIVPKR